MYPTEGSVHELMDKHTNRAGIQSRVLRDYQIEAAAAVEEDWAAGIKRVGVVLPTGSGKSTVIGRLVSDAYHRGHRILILAHRGELLDQIHRDTKAVDPDIPEQHFGHVRAEHDDHHAPIVLATLQTLAKAKRRAALGQRDVIIWDEVHHSPAVGYHATFKELGGYDGAFMCGFTATMYRSDNTKGRGSEIGLGDVIEKISYERDLRWAIEAGHLVPPTGLTVRVEALNALNKIKNVAGDFNQGDLAEIMEAAVGYTVDAIEMHASDRKSIVFAASVEAANQVTEMINERGKLRAGSTIGSMGYDERQPVYQQFRDGQIDCMVTCMVLTEGADFPMCDCVVMARPTRSRVLYSQMVGRALRTFEDKTDALVLDLSGSTRQMKLIHLSELVHGMGLDITEVDEYGIELEVPLCQLTGEPVNVCMCPDCVEERTPESRIRVKREGAVDMVTIDLLGETDTLWLETPAGVPFINLPDSEGWNVLLYPRDGLRSTGEWAIYTMNTRSRDSACADIEPGTEDTPVYYPMATAIKKAEETAVRYGYKLPSRLASWRKRNQAPSELQAGLARRLGIPGYENMTKGRTSDEISIALLSPLVDHAMVTE